MSFKSFSGRNHPNAFTLVELLIVVAIVLILIAVAAPSFMEANVRSNVSAARVRMEAMKQAMLDHLTDKGSLHPDFNDPSGFSRPLRLPCDNTPDSSFPTDGGLTFSDPSFRRTFYASDIHGPLTTPIKYIDPGQTIDPFSDGTVPFGYDSRYVSAQQNIPNGIVYGAYFSAGPDLNAGDWLRGCDTYLGRGIGCAYNPTNGTMSKGDFWGVVPGCEDEDCIEFASNEYHPLEWFPPYTTDLDGDGNVNELDLLILMQDWGKVSGP